MRHFWNGLNMIEKCNKELEKNRKVYQGLSTLARSARAIAKPILGMRGFSNTDIIENWHDILGPDLSVGIAPIKIVFPVGKRTHGTLHVKSAGGAFAMMCTHQKNRILNRINTYFGYPAVCDLKIKQGALQFKTTQPEQSLKSISKKQIQALKEKVSCIEDEELRQRIYEIGVALLSKKASS